MTPFSVAIGASTELKFLGQPIKIRPITLGVLGEVASHVRSITPDPRPGLISMIAGLPESLALSIFSKATADYEAKANLNPGQALLWAIDQPSNFAFLLFLLIEKSCPGLFRNDEVFQECIRLSLEDAAEYGNLVTLVYSSSGARHLGKLVVAALGKGQPIAATTMTGESSGSDSANPLKQAEEGSAPAL